MHRFGELHKADSRVDIALEHGFDPFAEKLFAELWIARDASADRVFEIAVRATDGLLPSPFVILPMGKSRADIVLLALHGAATQQNHKAFAILLPKYPR
jgi:hypothetical protein